MNSITEGQGIHVVAFQATQLIKGNLDFHMMSTSTWYLLTIDRKEVTLALAENWPLLSLQYACSQGGLSIKIGIVYFAWIMKGVKGIAEAPMASASTSHGSQLTWWHLILYYKNHIIEVCCLIRHTFWLPGSSFVYWPIYNNSDTLFLSRYGDGSMTVKGWLNIVKS